MLFNSWQFVIFFSIVFVLYWALPHKFRWIFLLISSYYFYMSWNVKYVFLILLTTIVSYTAALVIEKTDDKRKKNAALLTALLVCLGILVVFKYWNFLFSSINGVMRLFSLQIHPVVLSLLLPVGISFYVFQTLSYVIDVYKGGVKQNIILDTMRRSFLFSRSW